jgi:DNA primase
VDDIPSPRRPNIDVERLKNSIRLSDVVSRYTELRQSGRSRIGLCPFHADSDPSFVVTDELGVYYCHGCRASGDMIDFVRAIQNASFLEAVRYISGAIPAVTIPYARERARKLDRAKRALASAYARCQWHDAKPINRTPAEAYLRGRGITCELPTTLRFGVVPIWIDLSTGRKSGTSPALIGACQNAAGRITGVQRIFVQADGTRTPLPRPKLSLGAIKGGALRLGPVAPELVVCEGPEDGLTLYQMRPGCSVWVALGSGNMPFIQLPPGVTRVLVAGDNNPAGYKAAQDACEAFVSHGIDAEPIFPSPEFEDFNDELRGIRKPVVADEASQALKDSGR